MSMIPVVFCSAGVDTIGITQKMRRRRQPCNDSNWLSTSNVVGSLVTGRGRPKLAGAAL